MAANDEIYWDQKTERYVTGFPSDGVINPIFTPGYERDSRVHMLNEIRSLTAVLTKLLESMQAKP